MLFKSLGTSADVGIKVYVLFLINKCFFHMVEHLMFHSNEWKRLNRNDDLLLGFILSKSSYGLQLCVATK